MKISFDTLAWGIEEAVLKLDDLPDDSEQSHVFADEILLAWIRSNGGDEVAYAFVRARSEIVFWYS